MQKVNCVFCHINKKNEKILFETEDFIFLESKYPIVKGHHLLVSKSHVRSERELSGKFLREYKEVSDKAYDFIKRINGKDSLIIINAPQDQSIQHFHKHYIPGVFGALGVEKALKNYLQSGR